MKKMKKIYALMFAFATSLVFVFPQQSYAQTIGAEANESLTENTLKAVQPDSKEYYYDEVTGETITDLYSITDSGLKKISFEEFKDQRDKSREDIGNIAKLEEALLFENANASMNAQKKSITPAAALIEYYYTENIGSQVYMASYALTNPLSCAAGATSCSSSYSVSKTETESFQVSANTEAIKNAIKLGASFTWSTSATMQTTYTLTVPGGKSGEIRFQPLFNKTTGYLRGYINGQLVGTEVVTGYSPVKLATGMLAGSVYTRVW